MTKREGMKEAARRDGHGPEQIERIMQKIAMAGAWPWNPEDQITPGTEEAFIQQALAAKGRTDFYARTSPEFNAAMERKLASIKKNN